MVSQQKRKLSHIISVFMTLSNLEKIIDFPRQQRFNEHNIRCYTLLEACIIRSK